MIVEKENRYFLLNEKLMKLISKDFFYAGIYLGKTRGKIFFPSFNLLALIAEKKEANRVVVDGKTEWLFIVGRDVFKRGIMQVTGSRKKDAYTFVMNEYGECLGFGRITRNLDDAESKREVIVKNVSDIGDFLRRERRLED